MPTNDELDDDLLEEAEDMPEDLDEEDLDLEADEEDIDVLDAEEDDDADSEVIDDTLVTEEPVETDETRAKTPQRDDEDEDFEEEDEDTDDVEASLDVILKERLVVADDEEDEDDDEEIGDTDERGDSPMRVLPKQPGEFVCQSCFLVKHPSQLADASAMLCRDCV
jgi:hypothetical protein